MSYSYRRRHCLRRGEGVGRLSWASGGQLRRHGTFLEWRRRRLSAGVSRGCRQDWRARRRSSACRTTGTATTAKTTDVVMSCRRPTSARRRRPPCRRFRLHHHSFSSIFKRYLFRGKPRENQHHLRWAAGTGNGGGGDGRQWQQQGDSPVVLLLHPPPNASASSACTRLDTSKAYG